MECRKFTITLKSASSLPDVRLFGSMKVYAKVSLRGISDTTYETSVDEVGGTQPKWNTNFGYWVAQSLLEKESELILDIELYCQRTLGDRYVGQVNLNVKKLFDIAVRRTCNFAVKTEDGQPTEGTLEFSYTFGDLETVSMKEEKNAFFGKLAMAIVVQGTYAAVEALMSS